MRRLRFRGSRVEKFYRREDLLVDDDALKERIQSIEKISRSYEGVVPITFRWEANTLIADQQRLRRDPLPTDKEHKLRLLVALAGLIEQISPQIVHGDVCQKNLLFDGIRLHLIDWEPALRQMRDGRETMLYTEPYLSRRDRREEKLSSQTDKIGFFYLCFRILYGRYPFDDARRVVWLRQHSDLEITPIVEYDFLSLNFSQVLHLAEQSAGWKVNCGVMLRGRSKAESDE